MLYSIIDLILFSLNMTYIFFKSGYLKEFSLVIICNVFKLVGVHSLYIFEIIILKTVEIPFPPFPHLKSNTI